MSAKVKVGLIGAQFEADIHAASFQILAWLKFKTFWVTECRKGRFSRDA
jgi:hypothetical protein